MSVAKMTAIGEVLETVEEVKVGEETAEEVEGKPGEREILDIIAGHPEGIRLVDIGNELSVPWRALINVTKFLVDSGRIGKIETLYYPEKEDSE